MLETSYARLLRMLFSYILYLIIERLHIYPRADPDRDVHGVTGC